MGLSTRQSPTINMDERAIKKLDIAREFLDAAINFYMDGQNYFCVIHLAAAAEELFGAHLPEEERIGTRAWKAEKALRFFDTGNAPSDSEARRYVNEWKNEVKHMDNGKPDWLSIDPAFAAEHHIDQALVNYGKLGLWKSPTIRRFEEYQDKHRTS